jgi:hypothetical protein
MGDEKPMGQVIRIDEARISAPQPVLSWFTWSPATPQPPGPLNHRMHNPVP